MKLTIEIKETERGDVAVDITSNEANEPTLKEKTYAVNIIDLLRLELPKLCKMLGGKGSISGTGKPTNQ